MDIDLGFMTDRFTTLPTQAQLDLAVSFLDQRDVNLFSQWFDQYMARMASNDEPSTRLASGSAVFSH